MKGLSVTGFLLTLAAYLKNSYMSVNKQLGIAMILCFGVIGTFAGTGGLVASSSGGPLVAVGGPGTPADLLPERISQYEEDIDGLNKVYIFKDSPEYYERLRAYNKAALAGLQSLSFGSLSISDQVDYLLLQRTIRHSLKDLDQAQKIYEQVKFAIPFAQKLMDLQVKRRRRTITHESATANTLDIVKHDIMVP